VHPSEHEGNVPGLGHRVRLGKVSEESNTRGSGLLSAWGVGGLSPLGLRTPYSSRVGHGSKFAAVNSEIMLQTCLAPESCVAARKDERHGTDKQNWRPSTNIPCAKICFFFLEVCRAVEGFGSASRRADKTRHEAQSHKPNAHAFDVGAWLRWREKRAKRKPGTRRRHNRCPGTSRRLPFIPRYLDRPTQEPAPARSVHPARRRTLP